MPDLKQLRPAVPILVSAAIMVSLSMGLRQSLGLFMQPVTRDIAITVSQFTFAIAMQNLIWGLLQPVAGAYAGRYGFRPVMIAGALFYVAGLFAFSRAQGAAGVMLGAGVLMGAAMACTASAIALSVASRAVPATVRSVILGIITAAGSLGAIYSAPLGQLLSSSYGWRTGITGFFLLALVMLPAAWFAGRVDRIPINAAMASAHDNLSARAALGKAIRHVPFLVMTVTYFVCGMQLVFLTTHLPAYLEICGMDPMLGATALGTIGAFNVIGSLFFGWAGGRWPKQALLGLLYTSRSIVLAWYFAAPPTPTTTVVFAAMMGFLWLGVAPLVSGSVAEMFGLRWLAMIQGLAFMSHQLGSFLGAFGGGWLFDRLGSYDLAWKLGVGIGLAAGIAQLMFGLMRPLRPAPL